MNPYPFQSPEWYRWTHEEAQACHDVFVKWLRPRMDEIKGVIEIGCGAHDYYSTIFRNKQYVGIDSNAEVISARQQAGALARHRFVCADVCEIVYPDFYEPGFEFRPDLVFSRAVIDHIEDPEAFLQRCLDLSNRWVYMMNYRGYFPDLEDHQGERGPDGIWYGDISVNAIVSLFDLLDIHYHVLCIPTGRQAPEIQHETHIIVEKL